MCKHERYHKYQENRSGKIPFRLFTSLTEEFHHPRTDLGYVVVERAISYSAMVFNYGPAAIDIRLIKTESERLPNHSGIVVRFSNTKCLKVGESIPLHVTFHPRQFEYNEKRTEIEDTIHLEVKHASGATTRHGCARIY